MANLVNVDVGKMTDAVTGVVTAIGGNKEMVQQIVGEIEKVKENNKAYAIKALFEKGAIPAMFWFYLFTVIYNSFIVSFINGVWGADLQSAQIDESLVELVKIVILWVVGAKQGIVKVIEKFANTK